MRNMFAVQFHATFAIFASIFFEFVSDYICNGRQPPFPNLNAIAHYKSLRFRTRKYCLSGEYCFADPA